MILRCALLASVFVLLIAVCQATYISAKQQPIVASTSSRIVGGSDAVSGQFPHQASIRGVLSHRHFCGGSIVSSTYILTAAHCTIDERPSSIHVVLGAHQLSAAGVVHPIATIRNHEFYNRATLENDISLIETTNEIVFGDTIKAIPLINRQVQSEDLIVSGWGRTSASGPVPDNLKWLQTQSLIYEDCKKVLDINPDSICAFHSKSRGICFGDSGGGLIASDGIVGINSFVIESCAAGWPDGYTSVFYHKQWVEDIISVP